MAAPALQNPIMRHAVLVERLKSGEVAKFTPFLREIDKAIRERLTRDGLTVFQRGRLETMLREVDAILAGVLDRFTKQLRLDLEDFAAHEAQFTGHMLDNAGFVANVPAAGVIAAAAFNEPLQAGKGKLLAGFIKDWTESERAAITGAIRLGVAQGMTVPEMVKSIRGTKALNYADGLLAITSRHAEAVVRTSVAHVGAVARMETYLSNGDILKGTQWDATLDHRTCPRCGALDGRVFAFGRGPVEPLHPNCRCVRVPLLSDEFAFLNEGAKRSSKDGPVDAGLSYFQWLKQQDAAFQDAALGPSRARLLRNGGLTTERFAALQMDRRWQPLTLEDMKRLEPLAFQRAGL
jgi:SPP1 gp7 family putative phage head morphogenesis protein